MQDMKTCSEILHDALAGQRVSAQQGLQLLEQGDFLEIQMVARKIRERKHDPRIATYTVFQIVNYSTFCNVDCTFCSYYEPYSSAKGKVLSPKQIIEKMQRAQEQTGVRQVFLQGGVDLNLPFDYYLEVLSGLKSELAIPVHIRAFSPVELVGMEQTTGKSLLWVLEELKARGLDSVPGAGAEVLSESGASHSLPENK